MTETTLDSPRPKSKPPRRRPVFGWYARLLFTLVMGAWALAVLVGIAGVLVAFLVYDHVTNPGVAGPEAAFEVPDGATGQQVGELLTDAGLIEHPFFFRVAMRLEGSNKPIRSGIYDMPRGLSAKEYLTRLYEGPQQQLLANQFRVTIPEGLSIQQLVELAAIEDKEGFLKAVTDPERIAQLGVKAVSLEGFLMPNTYFFDEKPTAAELVDRMLAQFNLEYSRLLTLSPGAENLDMLTVVTVASLVEEEARVDDERPVVASVVYNRIAAKMQLGMDSTLQYALNKYGQRMLDADKQVDSPYNTYRLRGLPPGPISNPGVASLRAAMQPASTKYLYFVSNADGKTHTFSTNEREHQAAVAKYRREIAAQRAQLEQQGEATAPAE